MVNSKIRNGIILFMVLAAMLVTGCGGSQGNVPPMETLTIYHAGSLTVPFDQLETEFEALHPGVDVLQESGGSATMISKSIAQEEAGENPPDIIASADYKLIPGRLYDKGYADWYIAFARNKMVLCYRDGAPEAQSIVNGTRGWYDVLRNEAVSYGHSDPDSDPCGYRTLMVVQLAQKYYYDDAASFGQEIDSAAAGLYDVLIPGNSTERGRVGGTSDLRPGGSEEVVRQKSVDLIVSIQSGDLDYAFEYRSVAVQHGLNFIELDDYINLSKANNELSGVEDFYQEAEVNLLKSPGPPPVYQVKRGKPIIYGITIPSNSQHSLRAAEFVIFLLSERGQEIIEGNGQPFLSPVPLCDHPENMPMPIKEGTP
jgi:molybdate/tungstate transport system substrate-binding protein